MRDHYSDSNRLIERHVSPNRDRLVSMHCQLIAQNCLGDYVGYRFYERRYASSLTELMLQNPELLRVRQLSPTRWMGEYLVK